MCASSQDAEGKRDFKPQTFVLSEAIGDRMVANTWGDGPGVIAVTCTGLGEYGGGTYTLWLEVRKYGTPD